MSAGRQILHLIGNALIPQSQANFAAIMGCTELEKAHQNHLKPGKKKKRGAALGMIPNTTPRS